MRRAGQTPHGARPNREEARLRPDACRLGAPNLRVGRLSRAVMRGPEEWPSCRSNPADKIRLTGPAAFLHRRWSLQSALWRKPCPHPAVALRFAAAVLALKKS